MPANPEALAEREGIIIQPWELSPPLQAVYWRHPWAPPAVFIAPHVFADGRLYRCVLAEELGHHFTTAGRWVVEGYFSYYERLNACRVEQRALRWAAKYLMPEKELAAAVRDGCREPWEFAEWFEVTEEMVRFRLLLLRLCKCA